MADGKTNSGKGQAIPKGQRSINYKATKALRERFTAATVESDILLPSLPAFFTDPELESPTRGHSRCLGKEPQEHRKQWVRSSYTNKLEIWGYDFQGIKTLF